MTKVYRASPIRLRATQAELQQRERFLIDYATEHYPVTVRQKQGFGKKLHWLQRTALVALPTKRRENP